MADAWIVERPLPGRTAARHVLVRVDDQGPTDAVFRALEARATSGEQPVDTGEAWVEHRWGFDGLAVEFVAATSLVAAAGVGPEAFAPADGAVDAVCWLRVEVAGAAFGPGELDVATAVRRAPPGTSLVAIDRAVGAGERRSLVVGAPPLYSVDASLDALRFVDGALVGWIDLAERRVALSLDVEDEDASAAQRRRAVQRVRTRWPRLLAAEPTLRRAAARELADAAGAEADASEAARYRDEAPDTAGSLRPVAVGFGPDGGGQIEYRDASGTFFPTATLIVRFDGRLRFDEVEVA